MKYIVIILLILSGLSVRAQLPVQTVPTQFSTGVFKQGWHISDSGSVDAVRDTFYARYPGTHIIRIQGSDTAFWIYGGNRRWFRSLFDRDTVSLSSRINLKLNIIDTTNHWWGIGKRWVDTVYRVNDSTIGFTINNGTQQTFQILGRSSGGGGGGSGTVTSVGLSLPSAFNVTPSTITTSGTFAVTGAGTTLQYIRGNGTLATTDTGMIPNFSAKVRGLFSGASPITFNSLTGVIGSLRGNTTGQLGVATFNNSDFIDNGAGLISLRSSSGGAGVDTIYRASGIDSVYFLINGITHAIKDSIGEPVTTPTLDAVLTAGNTGYNKDIFSQNNRPNQAVIAIYNRDTTNDNSVARIDARAYRGKAVLTVQGGSHAFNGFQIYRYTQSPGSYLPYLDSTKTFELLQNSDLYSVPQLRNGLQLAFVDARYEVKLLSFDTTGRAGLANIEDPQGWLDLPAGNGAGGGVPSLRIRPNVFSANADAGAIDNTGTFLTYRDNNHNNWNLNDQCRNAPDGTYSAPSHSFANQQDAGLFFSSVLDAPSIVANGSGSAMGLLNTDATGYNGFAFMNPTITDQKAFIGYNNAVTRFRIAANSGFSLDFEAGGFNDNNPSMRIASGGNVLIANPTDNGIGKLQVTGKLTVSNHTIGSNSDSAVIWDRSTNEYKYAKINGGSGITSINSQTGASQTLAADNGLTVTTTTNTVTYTLGGGLTGFTQITGGGNSLVIGTSGSHLSGFTTYGDAINLFGNVRYATEDYATDANHTVPSTTTFEELHDVLTTDRTLTMPSAAQQGQILTIVTRFSAGSNHFNLASAITDNSTGSTFTQLDWGKTYDFYVNSSLAWLLIRKY